MGIFDKVNEMKDKAEDLADQAKDMAGKVPGGDAVADKIEEASEQVDDLTLYSFMFRNNQGVDSIDIFFEVDGDGYAIVAGSNTDPEGAFDTARQMALTVRGTPPL